MSRRNREPCPKCRAKGQDRSGDNLVSYEDGHKFCYACKYLVKTTVPFDPHRKAVVPLRTSVSLPSDCTGSLPSRPAMWLSSFDITADEVRDNFMQWSEQRKLLIFPFYGNSDEDGSGRDDEVIGWQGRYFAPDRPKYHTEGPRDSIFAYQNIGRAVLDGTVLVEDVVSAIKVGRYAGALPLLGSDLPQAKRLHLRHISSHLYFWLDWDKRSAAQEMASQCEVLGYKTRVIRTKKDPKELDDHEIQEVLFGVNYGKVLDKPVF